MSCSALAQTKNSQNVTGFTRMSVYVVLLKSRGKTLKNITDFERQRHEFKNFTAQIGEFFIVFQTPSLTLNSIKKCDLLFYFNPLGAAKIFFEYLFEN